MNKVFISYAREDHWYAQKLYADLRIAEFDVWLDVKCLLPGMNWENKIRQTIRESKYFIFLVSTYSNLNNRYLKRELDVALEIQSELPADQTFIIPLRVDDILPTNEALMKYNFIDVFKSYDKGLGRLLACVKNAGREGIVILGLSTVDTGQRAAINLEPFENYAGFIRDTLRNYPVSAAFLESKDGLYFSLFTKYAGVKIPDFLLEKYPDKITLVLQYSYDKFIYSRDFFTVQMYFDTIAYELTIPYDAIYEIVSTMGFRIHRFNQKKIDPAS